MAYPLLRFRTVQSVVPQTSELFFLFLVATLYVLTIAAIALLIFWIGFALLKKPLARLIFLPLLWVGFEFLRTKLSFSLAWVSVGEPLVEFLPLGIYARMGSIYILSFFIAFFNVALYESLKYLSPQKEKKQSWMPLLATVFIFFLLSAGGIIYVRFDQAQAKTGKTLGVAIVQVGSLFNYRPEEKDYYHRLLLKTKEVIGKEKIPKADLVVLPANYANPAEETEILENKLRSEWDFIPPEAAVLFGIPMKKNNTQYETSVLSQTDSVQTASKKFLFPFVEYFPLNSDRFLPKLKKFTTQYSHGENQVLVLEQGINLGVLFCSEEFVPQAAREARQKGAQILVISGNTDDFASTLAFQEVLRAGRLRALENNTYVIHALKSGISAIIDPKGRVIKELGKDEEGILYAKIDL